MTTSPARPAEISALADALHAAGAVRVPLDHLWALWTTAAPRLAGDPGQAAALSAALDDLASQDVLELPATAWDTSTTPPLPRFIRIPAARQATRDREWMRFPWRHELGWVASLPTLSGARLRDLIAIHDWLVRTDGGRVPVVPVRYRSDEVFGDEKCLDGIARTNLFGPGRLSLDMLACVRRPAPLPAVIIGAGPDALVVENSDPYWVPPKYSAAKTTIRSAQWRGVRKVFPSQVAALGTDVAGHGPVTGRVWYWGGLDPPGCALQKTLRQPLPPQRCHRSCPPPGSGRPWAIARSRTKAKSTGQPGWAVTGSAPSYGISSHTYEPQKAVWHKSRCPQRSLPLGLLKSGNPSRDAEMPPRAQPCGS